jgi:recombination protein RecR
MAIIPRSIQNTTNELAKLPGVGPRTAQRLTFFLLKRSQEVNDNLAKTIGDLQKTLKKCSSCQNYSEEEICEICEETDRERSKLCIVETPVDAFNLERTNFRGYYHILHGYLSPIDGITPEKLNIPHLFNRISHVAKNLPEGERLEIIMATNPSMEGEATANYIENYLKLTHDEEDVSCTRLARGLPMGADLEYIDEVTLQRALEGRK